MTPEEIAQRLVWQPVHGPDGRAVGSVLDADVGEDGTVSVRIEVEPGAVPPPMQPVSIYYPDADAREAWATAWEFVRARLADAGGEVDVPMDDRDDFDEDDELALRCLLARERKDPLSLSPMRGQPRTRIEPGAAVIMSPDQEWVGDGLAVLAALDIMASTLIHRGAPVAVDATGNAVPVTGSVAPTERPLNVDGDDRTAG